MQAVGAEALDAVVPELVTRDVPPLEQRGHQAGRVLLGQLIARGAAGHAPLLPRLVRCAH